MMKSILNIEAAVIFCYIDTPFKMVDMAYCTRMWRDEFKGCCFVVANKVSTTTSIRYDKVR